NLSSNMVTATLVSAVANTLLLGISSTLIIPAVISIIGMLSAFAFATPPSMPHIAIASSSEWSNTKDVFVYGFVVAIISVVLAVVFGYFIGILVF
ncbi:MAG: SLC13 family permease, partial [Clostridia bacterium]|nr:SLC13 family permease [Clostridia bacterium]